MDQYFLGDPALGGMNFDFEGSRARLAQVLGTKYLVLGTKYLVLGTLYQAPSTWYLVPSTKY